MANIKKNLPACLYLTPCLCALLLLGQCTEIPEHYKLTVNVNDAAGGSASRGPNQQYFPSGETVDISASAKPGYTFRDWTITSGTGTIAAPTSAKTTVTARADVTVTANFAREGTEVTKYAVTVSSKGSSAAGGGSYAQGETVNISAGTPPADQEFKNWTANVAVNFADANSPATTFTMPGSPVTVTANFAPSGTMEPPVTRPDLSKEFLLDDFADGDSINKLGQPWYFFAYNLPGATGYPGEYNAVITNAGLADGGNNPIFFKASTPGRGGSGDYCAGLKYTGMTSYSSGRSDPLYFNQGIGMGTVLAENNARYGDDFNHVRSISFWAKGTPGVLVMFSVIMTMDSAYAEWDSYMIEIEDIDMTWKQYKIKIYPDSGDLRQGGWSGKTLSFEREEVYQIQWKIESWKIDNAGGSGTGELYIDDIRFHPTN